MMHFGNHFYNCTANHSKASANTPEYQSEASETFLGKECDLHLTKEDSQFVAKQHNNTRANNVLSNSIILY